jgi:hypothetical protein
MIPVRYEKSDSVPLLKMDEASDRSIPHADTARETGGQRCD